MPETQFEVGDRVRVEDPGPNKREDYKGLGGWYPPMDETIGETGEVFHVRQNGQPEIRVAGHRFIYRTYHLTNLSKGGSTMQDLNRYAIANESNQIGDGPHYVVFLDSVKGYRKGEVKEVRHQDPDSDGELRIKREGPRPAFVHKRYLARCDAEGNILERKLDKVGLKVETASPNVWAYFKEDVGDRIKHQEVLRVVGTDPDGDVMVELSNGHTSGGIDRTIFERKTVIVEGDMADVA